MPTYSYRCANCGHEFDQYQSFTDDALTVCPVCGEPQLRKVFNSIGVTFNGSGFYRNDSRSAPTSSESSAPAKSEGSTAPTADAAPKPAAKPAAASGSGSAS